MEKNGKRENNDRWISKKMKHTKKNTLFNE